jgi:hypothetical protein
MYKRKERTNLSQKQKRKDREETFLFVRKGRETAPFMDREETFLYVREGRKTAPMKGQGINLSTCQERKRKGAHERTGKKLVHFSGKEGKWRP